MVREFRWYWWIWEIWSRRLLYVGSLIGAVKFDRCRIKWYWSCLILIVPSVCLNVSSFLFIECRVIMGDCWCSGLVTVLVGGYVRAEELIDVRVIIGELLGCDCIEDGWVGMEALVAWQEVQINFKKVKSLIPTDCLVVLSISSI